MNYKDNLIEKAEATIRNNKSLIEDDVAVAMLGIERIKKLYQFYTANNLLVLIKPSDSFILQ